MGDTRQAIIYVDGQNLRGSAINFFGRKEMDINLPRMLESIVRNERDMRLGGIRYYTGIEPKNGVAKYRAQAIALLNHIRDQGIETFANDLEVNPLGRRKEVGIDLKIAADMVSDLLNKRATSFILLSNDRDYEPVFDLMNKLAERTGVKIDLAVMTCGKNRGSTNARQIVIRNDVAQHHVRELAGVMVEAERLLERERDTALDARAHEKTPTPIPERTTDPAVGTAYLIDLNSIGTAAKQNGRTHLDAQADKLLQMSAKDTGKNPKGAVVFASIHTPQKDLINSLLVKGMTERLAQKRYSVTALPYEYSTPIVGYQDAGAGSHTPLRAPMAREKRIETTMLNTVVTAILNKKFDDFVLLSDNRNLWPIAEIAAQLGRMTKTNISVSNVHLGERGIPGMPNHRIDDNTYQAALDPVDRLLEAEVNANRLIIEERDEIITRLTQKSEGVEIVCRTNPLEAEGNFMMKSEHWNVMYEGEGQYALFEHVSIPPQPGQRYAINNGKMREVVETQIFDMDRDLRELEKSRK